MTSPGERLEQALAVYQQQLTAMSETRRKAEQIRATVTAPRRVVSATVGPRGELLELKFPTGAHKSMTPGELASTIVHTVEAARAKAVTELSDLMPALPRNGLSAEDLIEKRVDLGSLLPPEQPTVLASRNEADS
jgi:citrate lyase beta subunit